MGGAENDLQHRVDPTECGLTQPLGFQAAPFSLPTLHLPLDPRCEARTPTQWAPPPNLVAVTFPTGHAVVTAPPKARQSLCGAPVGSTLLLRAWLWATPICSQLHGQPQPATPGKGLLSPCSGHPGLSMNKALSSPFARGQAHAGSGRSGAGASDPERASGVDSYRSLQMPPFT